MKILVSKCDSLGDQLFFAKHFVNKISSNVDLILWIINEKCSLISKIIPNSFLIKFSDIRKYSNYENIQKEIIKTPHKIVFVACPYDPFIYNTNNTMNRNSISIWFNFLQTLELDYSISCTVSPTWIDRYNTLVTTSRIRLAGSICQPWQQIPIQFHNCTNVNISSIKYDEIKHVDNDKPEFHFFKHLTEKYFSDTSANIITTNYNTESKTILFSPGSSDQKRRWPIESFIKTLETLLTDKNFKSYNYTFILGPNEYDLIHYILPLNNRNRVNIFIASDDKMPEFISIVKSAKLVICNESFIYHLATYYRIPTVIISGGGHWLRFIDNESPTSLVYNYLPCFSCNWNCLFSQYKCITIIPLDTVLDAVYTRVSRPYLKLIFIDSQLDISSNDFLVCIKSKSIKNNLIRKHNKELLISNKLINARLLFLDNMYSVNSKLKEQINILYFLNKHINRKSSCLINANANLESELQKINSRNSTLSGIYQLIKLYVKKLFRNESNDS